MFKLSFYFLLAADAASAQRISLGAVAGANATDDFRSGSLTYPSPATGSQTFTYGSGGPHFLIGLRAEFLLPGPWSIEADAIRRSFTSTQSVSFATPVQLPNGVIFRGYGPSSSTRSNWEFPLLARYRLPGHLFVMAGPSFRPSGTGSGLSHTGISAGGGIELFSKGFRISPSLRYTRWSSSSSFGGGPGTGQSNQVEFLVGFDRPSDSLVSVFGKRLSVGAIVGIGLGKDFKPGTPPFAGGNPESNSAIFGVMLEAPLTRHLSIEVDGLYRPLHGSSDEFGRHVRFAHLTWEFPVLTKVRLREHSTWHPFLEGGPSLRAQGNLNLRPGSTLGGTVGAGVERRFHGLRIAPAFRYTRWNGGDAGPFPRTRANQGQLLLSFSH